MLFFFPVFPNSNYAVKISSEERYVVVIFIHKRLFSSLNLNKSSDKALSRKKMKWMKKPWGETLRPPSELVEVICFSVESCIPIQSFRGCLIIHKCLFCPLFTKFFLSVLMCYWNWLSYNLLTSSSLSRADTIWPCWC